MKPLIFAVLIIPLMLACSPGIHEKTSPIKVEIAEIGGGYQLLRGGQPYEIRGAGMNVDDMERFTANGGNSIRNWSTISDEQDTQALLEAAHANGVTVALGLPMRAERHGFDYDDETAVAQQLEVMRSEVLKLVTVDAGEDHMVQAQLQDRSCKLLGLSRVRCRRTTCFHRTEVTPSGAGVAEDHECSRTGRKAFTDVGTTRLFADGV